MSKSKINESQKRIEKLNEMYFWLVQSEALAMQTKLFTGIVSSRRNLHQNNELSEFFDDKSIFISFLVEFTV